MHCPLLTDNVKITKVKDPTTAGTSDVTSDAVDMQADGGYDGVAFMTSYGTTAADNLFHAESSEDNGSVDTFADIAGSEMNLGGASDEDQVLDVYQPPERYVRIVAQRGTSSTLGDIWAVQYRGHKLPVAAQSVVGTVCVQTSIQAANGTK